MFHTLYMTRILQVMKVFEIYLACVMLTFLSQHILWPVSSEQDNLASRQWLSIHENNSFEPGTFSSRRLYTQSSKQ